MNVEQRNHLLYIDTQKLKSYTTIFTFDDGCKELKKLCKETDINLEIIFRGISESTKSQVMEASSYIIDGYKENINKEDLTFILSVDNNMLSYIEDAINSYMAIERNKTKTFEEKFLKALKRKPEYGIQTKDMKLELIEFLEDPKYECKTNSLVSKDIEKLVQRLKDEIVNEKEDEIYIICNNEVITLTQFMKDNLYWDVHDARSEASSLYRTREFEKCKLGVAYDMIALYLKESDIRSYFLKKYDKIRVREFQRDFTHLYLFFKTHLMELNFRYE